MRSKEINKGFMGIKNRKKEIIIWVSEEQGNNC